MSEEESHPAIPDVYALDLVGKRSDGGVDLVIVVCDYLGPEEDAQRALQFKLDTYGAYRISDEFREEFGDLDASQAAVEITFTVEPHPVILELIEQLAPWAADHQLTLKHRLRKL